MNTIDVTEIRKMKAVVSVMTDEGRFPGQDLGLICQMTEEMLTDLETIGGLVDLKYYIRRYCDVADDPEEHAAELEREILTGLGLP